MTATILDGKAVAASVLAEVAKQVTQARSAGVHPCLAVVLVGDDPASQVYVRSKGRRAQEVGIAVQDHRLPATTTTGALLELVHQLNNDESVHGILVQLPLPAGVDTDAVLVAVDPSKDVDGFHPDNLGRLVLGQPRFVPCTPQGCMRLLEEGGVSLTGAHAVVIGRSKIVGKPVAHLLLAKHATVTIAHSRTADLAAEVARADVVVAAVGRANLVRGEWIRPGAAVIDVGINRNADGKLVGDVEFAAARERAGVLSPVPGGVGPMTIAYLMSNVVKAATLAPNL